DRSSRRTIHWCIDRRKPWAHNHTVVYGGPNARRLAAMFRGCRDRGGADPRPDRRAKNFSAHHDPAGTAGHAVVWQAGTVAWIGGGVLLIAAPWMASDPARHWIVATMAVVFAFAALGNAYATRG